MSLGGGGDAQSGRPDSAKKLGVQSKISIGWERLSREYRC